MSQTEQANVHMCAHVTTHKYEYKQMRIRMLALSLNSFKGVYGNVVGGRANWLQWLWKHAAESPPPPQTPKQDNLETGGKSGGRGKPKWNYGELSLPNWWGFIRHCQGQRIEVISFFMHGFCPHRDLKRRKRERERKWWARTAEGRDVRKGEEWRWERRNWKGEGRAEERRDKERGGEEGDEWEGETGWQRDV